MLVTTIKYQIMCANNNCSLRTRECESISEVESVAILAKWLKLSNNVWICEKCSKSVTAIEANTILKKRAYEMEDDCG